MIGTPFFPERAHKTGCIMHIGDNVYIEWDVKGNEAVRAHRTKSLKAHYKGCSKRPADMDRPDEED